MSSVTRLGSQDCDAGLARVAFTQNQAPGQGSTGRTGADSPPAVESRAPARAALPRRRRCSGE